MRAVSQIAAAGDEPEAHRRPSPVAATIVLGALAIVSYLAPAFFLLLSSF